MPLTFETLYRLAQEQIAELEQSYKDQSNALQAAFISICPQHTLDPQCPDAAAGAIVRSYKELEQERDQLKAVIDKLPKTADGVPMVHGMKVYGQQGDQPRSYRLFTVDGIVDGRHCWMTDRHKPDGTWTYTGKDVFADPDKAEDHRKSEQIQQDMMEAAQQAREKEQDDD